MAEDAERLQKLRKILCSEFDLEILHKLREVQVIESQMSKIRELLQLVEKIIVNEYVYGDLSEGAVRSRARSRPGTPRSNTHSTSNKHPHLQYDIKADGTIVQMQCPKCGAELFRSMLGFLNHCRIHCRLAFESQDDRLDKCGIAISADAVPKGYFQKHPSQVKQEMDLAMIRADIGGPLKGADEKAIIRITSMIGNGNDSDNDGGLGGAADPAAGLGAFYHQASPPPSAKNAFLYGNHNSTNRSLVAKRQDSRFYFGCSLIIGNAARIVRSTPVSKEDGFGADDMAATIPQPWTDSMHGKRATHEFKIYLRNSVQATSNGHSGNTDPLPLESWIRAVRFILHPSYRPNHVIDCTQAPFEVTLPCFGEFPVRCQIFFWDEERNPMHEIVHVVRMLTASSGRMTVLAEQLYDVNVDKKSRFWGGGGGEERAGEASAPNTTMPFTPLPPHRELYKDDHSGEGKDGETVDGYDLLRLYVGDVPLIGVGLVNASVCALNHQQQLDYNPIGSLDTWTRMNVRDQLALEQKRAQLLTQYITRMYPSSFSLSPTDIIHWARKHKHSPPLTTHTHTSPQSLRYCRFCGRPHAPLEKFDILQKNCAYRPRKMHVSSKLACNQLMQTQMHANRLLPTHSDAFKRLRQEYFFGVYGRLVENVTMIEWRWRGREMCGFEVFCGGLVDALPLSRMLIYKRGGGEEGKRRGRGGGDGADSANGGADEAVEQKQRMNTLLTIPYITAATKTFLKTLLSLAVNEVKKDAGEPSLLTPLHVYNCIVGGGDGPFAFLCNRNMVYDKRGGTSGDKSGK